jgi:hypothetical protein
MSKLVKVSPFLPRSSFPRKVTIGAGLRERCHQDPCFRERERVCKPPLGGVVLLQPVLARVSGILPLVTPLVTPFLEGHGLLPVAGECGRGGKEGQG